MDQEIKLDKIKITPFSDAKDWESTLFELKLVLRQVWRDKTLDITQYITDETYAASVYDTHSQKKVDELIYYILSTGSVRGSFARNAIIAALSTTAQPHIADNEGLSLLLYFNNIFVFHDEHATSLPIAQQKFHSLKQKKNETTNNYIARVDLAVSSLSKLGEPVSQNTWIFALVKGLRSEYEETKKGVNFAKPGFQTVKDVKKSILSEESIMDNASGKQKHKLDDKTDTAFSANENKNKTCHYCNKMGHVAPECRKKQRDKAAGATTSKTSKSKGGKSQPKGKGNGGKGKNESNDRKPKGAYWCDNCQVSTHSTDYCRAKPQTSETNAYGKGEKGSVFYSKGKGKPSGKSQGWSNSNFPSDYSGAFANTAADSYSDNTQRNWRSWDTQDTWHNDGDLGFMVQHDEEDQGSADNFPPVPSIEQQFGLEDYDFFPTLFQIYIQWDYVSAPPSFLRCAQI